MGNLPKVLMAEHHEFDSVFRVGCHHYARLLARECQVLYLSPPLFILRSLVPFVASEKQSQKKRRDSQFLEIPDNLDIGKMRALFPPFIPLSPWYLLSGRGKVWQPKWLIYSGLKYAYPRMQRVLRERGYEQVDILLLGVYSFYPLLDMVKAKLKVYRMIDDISGFQHLPSYVERIEKNIIRKVDKVIITSRNLEKRARMLGAKEIYYLPNGVDFNHFNSGISDEPSDLKPIRSPRIVYVGAIQNWLDLPLLEHCARELPSFSFILIGPPTVDLSILLSHKNIYILGPRNYELLPAYLRNCDVGIIPFKKARLTDSVSPVKFYEYMASGLPVASIETAELKSLNSPAFLAKDEHEFVDMIKSALKLSKEEKESFVEFARRNTWEQRYQQLKVILGLR